MMWSFVPTVFVLFLLKFHEQVYATRYLPSIVWDHYNPILSCKCNWFHPETLMEIYDRFVFVCPTQAMNVALLADQSRPDDRMNLNIFERRWNGTIEELKKQMKSGEFCDPEHQETQKKFTCRHGDMGKYKTMRFARDTGYKKDDIVVWFNNVDDGKASSLTSTAKRCAMALIAKVTWNVATKYNFDYKKNLDRDRWQCNDLNVTCNDLTVTCNATRTETTTITNSALNTTRPTTNSTLNTTRPTTNSTLNTTRPTTNSTLNTTRPTTNSTLNTTRPTPSDSTTNATTTESPTTTVTTTLKQPCPGRLTGSPYHEDWDSFRNGYLAGFATMLFIAVITCLIYCIVCRPARKNKKRKYSNCMDQQSAGNNNLGSEREANALPEKSLITESQGINNRGFQTTTLKRQDNPA